MQLRSPFLVSCATVVSFSFVAATPILQSILKLQTGSSESIRTALQDAEVIPDVLVDFTPTYALSISYASSHTPVSLGNTIPVSSTASRPVFQIIALQASVSSLSPTRTLSTNRTYTLVLSDPDATSRADPVKSQMCHWIVTGIELRDLDAMEGLQEGDESSYALNLGPTHSMAHSGTKYLDELIEYLQPAPPPGTGKHRYVFALLESKGDNEKGRRQLKKPKERPHWGYGKIGKGVMDWANDNDLLPVGANFFYAQNEEQ